MRFAGKTVVITGAASGIGRETVLKFAAEGAIVYAADRDVAGGESLVAETNGDVRFVPCDVTDVAQIKALMDRAAADTGGIDVVFNNAGAAGAREPIDEIDAEGWDGTMDLLLRSVAMGIRYAVPHMKGRPGASFVNTASIAALGTGYSPTAYAVAKVGVLHLSKMAAADLAKYGIRVNAICPGFIKTNIFTSALEIPEEHVEAAKQVVFSMADQAQPVARGGQPADIAAMVMFLASPEAGFITGTHMVVDGGITIGPRHSWDPEAPGMFDALQAMVPQPS
ncbi:SDR family oxidoreductase [Sphingomonas lacunae]|uniref:SDR family oxidoreductase n=1 Tax=Sphingomonas lacunae TaxID=2698828 RepID=A0A6M4AWW9_9SPHN|nr:SDR family NAD(P)-dependent oxidoreductase [Sphingomonas lacunae]QJQ31461.1 SDR family oxidoreductase [Sphingomonas lacunae]